MNQGATLTASLHCQIGRVAASSTVTILPKEDTGELQSNDIELDGRLLLSCLQSMVGGIRQAAHQCEVEFLTRDNLAMQKELNEELTRRSHEEFEREP